MVLSLPIFSCSTGGTTTTASATNVVTTTTTLAPTTTATVAPTTTTTEFLVGVNPEFTSTEKTLADTTEKIAKGEIPKKSSNVPAALNRLFRSKNPGADILYVGQANRDAEMNAVITSKDYILDDGNMGPLWNFLGGDPTDHGLGPGRYNSVSGEFLDIIPAVSPLEPDTKDFYMRLLDPLAQRTFYVRINITDPIGLLTAALVFDLTARKQSIPTFSSGNREKPF